MVYHVIVYIIMIIIIIRFVIRRASARRHKRTVGLPVVPASLMREQP